MDNIRPDKDHHVLMCRKILQTRKASPKYHLEYVKLLNTYCNTSTQSDNNGLTNKCMENIKKKGNWFISRQWVLINLFVMNVNLSPTSFILVLLSLQHLPRLWLLGALILYFIIYSYLQMRSLAYRSWRSWDYSRWTSHQPNLEKMKI